MCIPQDLEPRLDDASVFPRSHHDRGVTYLHPSHFHLAFTDPLCAAKLRSLQTPRDPHCHQFGCDFSALPMCQ